MIKKQQENEYFLTTDLAIAVTLRCYDYQIESIDKSNPQRAIFLIKKDKNLDSLIQSYWANQLQVNPVAYFNFLKEAKARLYS